MLQCFLRGFFIIRIGLGELIHECGVSPYSWFAGICAMCMASANVETGERRANLQFAATLEHGLIIGFSTGVEEGRIAERCANCICAARRVESIGVGELWSKSSRGAWGWFGGAEEWVLSKLRSEDTA